MQNLQEIESGIIYEGRLFEDESRKTGAVAMKAAIGSASSIPLAMRYCFVHKA